MIGVLAVCVRLSLLRGRGWVGEVTVVELSKRFLCCLCLVFSRSFVHDCTTVKCFQNERDRPAWKLNRMPRNVKECCR